MEDNKWLEMYSVPDLELRQLCGCRYWKQLFGACIPDSELDEFFEVPCTHAFLLHGPAGNGKRTLALALAGELGRAGYRLYHISGEALAGGSESEAEADIRRMFREIVDKAGAGTAGKKAAGFYLFLDDMKPLAPYEKALCTLEQEIRTLEEREVPCVIAGTVEDISACSERLLFSMIPCAVGLPAEGERRYYMERELEGKFALGRGLTYKKMAQRTEGFNYGKLRRMVLLSAMLVKQRVRALGGSSPERRKAAAEQGGACLTEEMFADILEQLGAWGSRGKQVPTCGEAESPVQVSSSRGLGQDEYGGGMSSKSFDTASEKKGFREAMESLDLDSL